MAYFLDIRRICLTDKADAYGIQGQFFKHIKEIHGEYNNVAGLPIGRLYNEILRLKLI
ncbi:MAG: Maf family protein [Suipraeoptans sp.]